MGCRRRLEARSFSFQSASGFFIDNQKEKVLVFLPRLFQKFHRIENSANSHNHRRPAFEERLFSFPARL
jgi:hypothetical protein